METALMKNERRPIASLSSAQIERGGTCKSAIVERKISSKRHFKFASYVILEYISASVLKELAESLPSAGIWFSSLPCLVCFL
jgi:hypothetical protein